MNKKTVAYLDAHNERPTQKSGSGPAAKGSGPAADIAVLRLPRCGFTRTAALDQESA